MIAHPIARRRQLNKDQIRNIQRLSNIGSKTQDIIDLIQKESNILIKLRDIYNIQAELKRKRLDNQTPLESLKETLENNGWKYAFKKDAEGDVLLFMFAQPESIRLDNKYNRVFLLDCAYKAKRYNMPLLHIVGLSPSNSYYNIAFCFIQNEVEESYRWVLQTFFLWLDPLPFGSVLFTDRNLALLGVIKSICPQSPHLLCIWYINQNIFANTKQYFSSNEEFVAFVRSWKDLINSSTIVEYNDQLAKFEVRFCLAPAALQYVKETWLTYKEMFIRAWTGQHLHLGNWVTSRVEGTHASLTKHIALTDDVLCVSERIKCELIMEHQKLLSDLSEDKIKALTFCFNYLYSKVSRKVSQCSLHLIYDQASIAKRATSEAPLSPCTNIFTRTMGLPCAHRIAYLLSTDQPIPLSDINQFWRVGLSDNIPEHLPEPAPVLPSTPAPVLPLSPPVTVLPPQAPLPVLPPQTHIPVLPPRTPIHILPPPTPPPTRVSYQSNKTSTQKITKRKAPSKCSKCGEIGHTIRSCRLHK